MRFNAMKFLNLSLLICLLLSVIACSGASTVVTPDNSLVSAQSQSVSGTQLWGLFDVSIDPDTLEAVAIPARTAEFRMDVNTFMNSNPASLKLTIVDGTKLKTTGEVTLNVALKHPVNNPKFAGFDVHCVLLSNGTSWLNYDSTLVYPLAGSNTYLQNPDGWTRWYNAVEFTTPGTFGFKPGLLGNLPHPQATLNGYKLYADGLGTTDNSSTWLESNQANRAIFTPGSTNTRQWKIQFPMISGKPLMKYQYAVVASWAKPSSPTPGPADFPPEASIQEASQIRIDSSQSTLYYTPSKSGGDLILNIDIFDWQGDDDIQDQISRIIIESDVLTDTFIADSPVLSQTAGSAFGTYSISIPSDQVNSTNDANVWVAVESKAPTSYLNVPTSAYPTGAKLTAFTLGKATVSDEAPPEPPQIISGVTIDSGTNECPDRSADNNAVFSVLATGGLPLTYTWNILIIKSTPLQKVNGYNNVPGDGAGHLSVDFTTPAFENIVEMLNVTCEVSDGVNPPVSATPLVMYLDCVIFNANLNDLKSFDNFGWMVADTGLTLGMVWTTTGASGPAPNLAGKGALWQADPDMGTGVLFNSKGMLLSPPIHMPEFLTSASVEVDHYYSFDPITMGGNIKIGAIGSLNLVSNPFKPIASGDDYDGVITDNTNPMYPQSVFSASGVSDAYHSVVTISPSLFGQTLQIGFGAASGATADPDGGWLIDLVKIIGTI
jgi:hypothetical protein